MQRQALVLGSMLGICLGSACLSPRCVPGASVSCACPTGASGAQVCAADGSGYGACICQRSGEPPAVVAGTGDRSGIRVVSATYGSVCGVAPGNGTSTVAGICNGQPRCTFRVDNRLFRRDPAPNCSKDFRAEWTCGADAKVYTTSAPARQNENYEVSLECPCCRAVEGPAGTRRPDPQAAPAPKGTRDSDRGGSAGNLIDPFELH